MTPPLTPGDLAAIAERDADLGNPPGGLRENYTPAADDRRALLAHVRSLTERVESLELTNTLLQGHRQDAEEQVRSLTVERDQARRDSRESLDEHAQTEANVLLARLSRAREALDTIDAMEDPDDTYHASWAALRSALTEETTPRE